MAEMNVDLGNLISKSLEEAKKKMGRFKLLTLGKTGVGKSTLINSIFRENLAATGSGRPVTKGLNEITKEDFPLTLVDSQGLEVKDYSTIVSNIKTYVETCRNDVDPAKHIHCVWLCINSSSNRIEEGEKILLDYFNDIGIPVIVVVTQCGIGQKEFLSEIKNEMQKARQVIEVRAKSIEIEEDGEIITLKQKGLEELIACTYEIAPDGAKLAISNAVKNGFEIGLKLKREEANKIITQHIALASTAGAAPIPFSDFIAIVPIQITMLARISMAFGLSISQSFISTLISGSITAVGASVAGRTIVSGLLKLIPGVGSLIGGAVSATTAGAITGIFGKTYSETLVALIKKNPEKIEISNDEIIKDFKDRLKKKRPEDA